MKRPWSAGCLFLALAGRAAVAANFSTAPRVLADVRGLALSAAADFRAGHYQAAAIKYQTIVAQHPDCEEAWSDLGKVCSQDGRVTEAIRALKQAVRLDPHDAAAQTGLGLCYFEQHKYSAAIPSLEQAERLNPENSNVHACLARCYEKTGRQNEEEQERQIENLQQMDTYP